MVSPGAAVPVLLLRESEVDWFDRLVPVLNKVDTPAVVSASALAHKTAHKLMVAASAQANLLPTPCLPGCGITLSIVGWQQ
ncbi:hypothetical protein GCM10027082_05620 [Comamonas humi]